MGTITSILPSQAKKHLRQARNALRAPFYRGTGRLCPVCGKSSRRFRTFGIVPRPDAQCVHCGALERHRLLWYFVQNKVHIFSDPSKRMLHVAPEACFESKIKELLGNNYLTADLSNPETRVQMDITNINYPDNAFDIIFCNHVLEHVIDDKRAISEMFRVLSDTGCALLLVPITADKTFEDPSITDPAERLRLFGQEDHVRKYGPDYADRLQEAGFKVQVITAKDMVNEEEATKFGFTKAGDIFFCTKLGATNG